MPGMARAHSICGIIRSQQYLPIVQPRAAVTAGTSRYLYGGLAPAGRHIAKAAPFAGGTRQHTGWAGQATHHGISLLQQDESQEPGEALRADSDHFQSDVRKEDKKARVSKAPIAKAKVLQLRAEKYLSHYSKISQALSHLVRTRSPRMDLAMPLWHSFCAMMDRETADLAQPSMPTSKVHRTIWRLIFRMCALNKDLDAIIEVQSALRTRKAEMTPSMRFDMLLVLMGTSKTFEDAFGAYLSVKRAWKGGLSELFGVREWQKLLSSYLQMGLDRLETRQMIPLETITQLLRDMHAAQSATPRTYASLLDYFGKAATADTSRTMLQEYRYSVGAIHRMLLQSAIAIDPSEEVFLVTTLMDAYSRVGLYQAAMDIWRRLVMQNAKVHPMTAAVALDTCGRAGDLTEARRVFAYVTHTSQRQAASKGMWDAWIECQARCGNLKEAMYDALYLMEPFLSERKEEASAGVAVGAVAEPTDRSPLTFDHVFGRAASPPTSTAQVIKMETRPDEKTFNTLLKFASLQDLRAKKDENDLTRPEILAELERQIRQRYPDVWPLVREGGIS